MVILLVVRSSSSSFFWIVVGFVVLVKDLVLVGLVVNVLGLGSWEDVPELLDVIGLELALLRELDVELDEQVARAHLVLEEWHAHVPDQLGLVVGDDLAWHGGDLDLSVVNMLELKGEAGQGLE